LKAISLNNINVRTKSLGQSWVLWLIPVLLSACSYNEVVTDRISPYRIDVRQGNFVTQEMVSQLRPGMTPDQVRFVLGTPLVTDVFHADRWDYIYRFKPGKGDVVQRVMTVYFKNGRLDRVAGDVVAAEPQATPQPQPDNAPAASVEPKLESATLPQSAQPESTSTVTPNSAAPSASQSTESQTAQ